MIKRLCSIIRRKFVSKFFSDVFTLSTGTALAHLISIVVAPVLTRLYLPEDFGFLALFTGVVSILTAVSTGRYDIAIMLPDKDDDAINILALSCSLSLALSIILLLIIFLFSKEIADALGSPEFAPFLYLVPIFVFLAGVLRSLDYWFNRRGRYTSLSFCRVTQSSSGALAKIVMGCAKLGGAGLIVGSIIDQIIGSGFLGYQTVRDMKDEGRISFKRMREMAGEYRDFPQKSVAGYFLNVLSTQLPILIIAKVYGVMVVGYYSLTLRVLSFPIVFLGRAIAQVFYRKAAESRREGTVAKLVSVTSLALLGIIILPMLLIVLFGEGLFGFVFGEKWIIAGTIAAIMAPFYLIRFIFSIQSTLLMVYRRLDVEVVFNFLFLVSQIIALLGGYYFFHNYIYSFIFMSVAGGVVWLGLGFFLFKLSKTP